MPLAVKDNKLVVDSNKLAVDCACCVNCLTDGPTANFTWDSDADCIVTFTDTSTAGTSAITGWNWDFGDTNSSTSQNPIHNYSGGGPYTVTLTVTDANGCTSEATDTVYCCLQCPDDAPDTVTVTGSGFQEIITSPCEGDSVNTSLVLDRIDDCTWRIDFVGINGCCWRVTCTISSDYLVVTYALVTNCIPPYGPVSGFRKARVPADNCRGSHILNRYDPAGPFSQGGISSPGSITLSV